MERKEHKHRCFPHKNNLSPFDSAALRKGQKMIEPYYQDDSCIIYNCDYREILPELEPVDLILTDPPYIIECSSGGAFGDRKHLTETKGFTDGGVDYSFLKGFDNWFCFCSFVQLCELLSVADSRKGKKLLTWNKPNPCPAINNKYLPDVEYIVHSFSKNRLFGKYKHRSSYHIYPCGNKATSHPNEKPLPVIKRLLILGSKENETILDPYMGSGTTLRAAKDLGRKAIGIEIEEKYCEIAAKRLAQEVLDFG